MNNPRGPLQFLFYPFVLCLLATGIYFIYQKNPALMDQLSLIEKQQQAKKSDVFVVYSQRADSDQVWETTNTNILPLNNSYSHSKDQRVDHRYDEFGFGPSINDEDQWSFDKAGLIVNNSKAIHVYNLELEKLWSFESEKELCDGKISTNENYLAVCYKGGGLSLHSRSNGHILWSRKDSKDYFKNPLLIDEFLYSFEKSENDKWQLTKSNARTGNEINKITGLSNDLVWPVTFSKAKYFMFTADKSGHIRAYDLKSMKALWKSDLVADFAGPTTYTGEKLLAMNKEGLLYGLNQKSGELLWEYDLKRSSPFPVTAAEGLGIGAVIDSEGYLHMLDIRAGKRKWRFNTQTDSKMLQMVAIRLFASNAEKLNMGAESQGWLFWGPCKGSQICAFEPFKGLLIRRIDPEAGKILHPPIYLPGTEKMALLIEENGERKFKVYADRDWIKQQKEGESLEDAVDNAAEDN